MIRPCARLAAALVLAMCFIATGCPRKAPPAPAAPKPVTVQGPGFTVSLPPGFTGMDVQEQRVFTAGGSATVRTHTANSHPLILEVHTIFPDTDPGRLARAVRDADNAAFRPGLYRAVATLAVETRVQGPERDPGDLTPLDRLAAMLVTRDAAMAVRSIMGAALPPESAQDLAARMFVRADEAEGNLEITVICEDPALCAATAGAYVRFLQERNGRHLDHVIDFLEKRVEKNVQSVAWYDKSIAYYRKDLGMGSYSADPTDTDRLINELELDRARAEIDLVTVHAQLFEARRLAPGAPGAAEPETQYAVPLDNAPPRVVENKSGVVQGQETGALTEQERVNEKLRQLEFESRTLMMGKDKVPPEAVPLALDIADLRRKQEALIREQVAQQFAEKTPVPDPEAEPQPGESGRTTGAEEAPAPGPALPAELREKIMGLEISLALEKARFERMDRSTRMVKKSRAIADSLTAELARLIREQETQQALGALYRERLGAVLDMAAGSPLNVKSAGPPQVSAKPVYARARNIPDLAAHLLGGLSIDKKEPTTLGGRAAVAIQASMPWAAGRDVFTYQALVAMEDRIYWLRAIALEKATLQDPAVARFFTKFKITR